MLRRVLSSEPLLERGQLYHLCTPEDLEIVKTVACGRSYGTKPQRAHIKGVLGELALFRLLGEPIGHLMDTSPNCDLEDRGDLIWGPDGLVVDVKATEASSSMVLAVSPSKQRRADIYVLMAIRRRSKGVEWEQFDHPEGYTVEFVGAAPKTHVFSPIFAGAPFSQPFFLGPNPPAFYQIAHKLPLGAISHTFPPSEPGTWAAPDPARSETLAGRVETLSTYMNGVGLDGSLASSVAQYLPGYVPFPLGLPRRNLKEWNEFCQSAHPMQWSAPVH